MGMARDPIQAGCGLFKLVKNKMIDQDPGN